MPQPAIFGPFRLDPDGPALSRDGRPVALGHRALSVLAALLAAGGRTVTKAALMDATWPGLAVEEANLTVQIAALRKALGPRPDGQDWIVTLPRIGYRMALDAPPPTPDAEGDMIRLAVQTFDTADADYFARGVVQDIIAALVRFRSFVVLTPPTASTAAALSHDGADFALRGSARRAGNHLRIVANLQEAATGRVLWAQKFDGGLDQVFTFQDQITETVAAMVEPQVERAALARSRRKAPGNLTAHDFYLQALPQIHAETEAGNREASRLLDRALVLDPANAVYLAHASWVLEHRISAAWPPFRPDDAARCLDFAHRAQAGANGDSAVLAHCAMAHLHVGKDYPRALDLARAALDANPNSIRTLIVASVAELHCGDLALAMARLDRALTLSPADPMIHIAFSARANVHLLLGDPGQAAREAARAISVNPAFDAAHWIATAALAQQGRRAEAAAALDRLHALTPGLSIARIRAAQPCRFPERLEILLDGLRKAGLAET